MLLTDTGNWKEIGFIKAEFPLFNVFFRNVGIEFYLVSQRTQSLILSK